jgi:hypothetical protein
VVQAWLFATKQRLTVTKPRAASLVAGRAVFAEALAAGTMVGFFTLIEQFT